MSYKQPKARDFLSRSGEKIPPVLETYCVRVGKICSGLNAVIENLKTKRGIKTYCKTRENQFNEALTSIEEGRRKILEGVSKLLQ